MDPLSPQFVWLHWKQICSSSVLIVIAERTGQKGIVIIFLVQLIDFTLGFIILRVICLQFEVSCQHLYGHLFYNGGLWGRCFIGHWGQLAAKLNGDAISSSLNRSMIILYLILETILSKYICQQPQGPSNQPGF